MSGHAGDRQDPINPFIEAARRGDMERIHEMVDWPASGVARFVASLRNLPQESRAEMAQAGMAEIHLTREGELGVYPLSFVMLRLSDEPTAQPLDPAGLSSLIERLRPAPAPLGLPHEIVGAIEQLRSRIDAISKAWVVTFHRDEHLYLGLLPDNRKLALNRPLRNGQPGQGFR